MKTPAKKVTRKDYKAMKAEAPVNKITPRGTQPMEGVTEEKVIMQNQMKDITPVDMPIQPVTSKLSYEDAAAKIKSNKTLLADFKAKKASTPKGKEFTMTIGGQTFRYKGTGERNINEDRTLKALEGDKQLRKEANEGENINTKRTLDSLPTNKSVSMPITASIVKEDSNPNVKRTLDSIKPKSSENPNVKRTIDSVKKSKDKNNINVKRTLKGLK